MPFIRTELGTDFTQPSGMFGRLLSSIDTANPRYRGKYRFIRSWMIEFDSDGLPMREIGLDANDFIVVAGPSDKIMASGWTPNYSFEESTNACILVRLTQALGRYPIIKGSS